MQWKEFSPYTPYDSQRSDSPRYDTIRIRGLHAFISNNGLGPEYTAQAMIFDGRLTLNAVILDTDMDENVSNQMDEKIQAYVLPTFSMDMYRKVTAITPGNTPRDRQMAMVVKS